ncbi:uncharacterized protein LOC127158535, partial [Labeo rohita]|uniref:uncharacterized protein LOC127158535 n=1 Tax=Labeo rohita TaxID=84645 RepID=UPI0021E2B684
IAEQFGEDSLKVLREYEKTARKVADYRNHVRFHLRCRRYGITPKSLRLRSSLKGHKATDILHRAQKQLLNERIRQVHFTLEVLKQENKLLHQKLATKLPEEILYKVTDFVQHAQLAQHTKSKERQIKKFDSLCSYIHGIQQNISPEEDVRASSDKWVKNLSDRELTGPEMEVLAKGLNFAVTPDHIPVIDMITATESAIRNNNIPEEEAEQLRAQVSMSLLKAKPPPPNLSEQEKRALTSLSKDINVTILPADKGRCTVVLNADDYHSRVTALLSDYNTYEILNRDPTSKYKKQVIKCLQLLEKQGVIDRKLYYRLYPGDTTPCLYGLPKVHKDNYPLRPIVSSINSVTYNIAKYLATVLAPLVGNTPHHVNNSMDFVDKIRGLSLQGDETMVSYDVISLFTCVPTVLAVETVRSRLSHDPMLRERTQLNPDQVSTLLELCLNTTYFKYKDVFYRQKHGCAMGSPVSPIVANLYMEEVEKKALETYSGTLPTHWFRYVDDTWVKIKINEIGPFTDHINSVDDYIKFTKEEMRENQLPFLDCGMYLENEGDLQVEVYRKPTHTDQYLMFDSHHPLEHKLGVIRTLQHRAGTIPTNQEARIKEQKHIEKALKQCHYPKWAFIKAQKNKPNDPKSGNIKIKRPRRSHVVIPYVAGLSEKFRRVFSKHNIPVYFKPKNTLRQMLVHPKDQVPKHQKCNLVYAVKCTEECKDLYIGETKQMLSKRMSQHRRGNSSGQESAVFTHLQKEQHSFKDQDVYILDREDGWFERGVKEAIYVKVERPSLNRGGGLRHHLSSSYNAVLRTLPRRFTDKPTGSP